MWVARSHCGLTGGTTSRAPTASSGWWTALTASACRTAGGSCRACWWRSAWLERPSSSLPTSRTCQEHCPPAPSRRPWIWSPSAATTGASRAAAPSPGRACWPASTGSSPTSPAASSPPTEQPQAVRPALCEHHHGRGTGAAPAQLTLPAPAAAPVAPVAGGLPPQTPRPGPPAAATGGLGLVSAAAEAVGLILCSDVRINLSLPHAPAASHHGADPSIRGGTATPSEGCV